MQIIHFEVCVVIRKINFAGLLPVTLMWLDGMFNIHSTVREGLRLSWVMLISGNYCEEFIEGLWWRNYCKASTSSHTCPYFVDKVDTDIYKGLWEPFKGIFRSSRKSERVEQEYQPQTDCKNSSDLGKGHVYLWMKVKVNSEWYEKMNAIPSLLRTQRTLEDFTRSPVPEGRMGLDIMSWELGLLGKNMTPWKQNTVQDPGFLSSGPLGSQGLLECKPWPQRLCG